MPTLGKLLCLLKMKRKKKRKASQLQLPEAYLESQQEPQLLSSDSQLLETPQAVFLDNHLLQPQVVVYSESHKTLFLEEIVEVHRSSVNQLLEEVVSIFQVGQPCLEIPQIIKRRKIMTIKMKMTILAIQRMKHHLSKPNLNRKVLLKRYSTNM
jgi:hypothetical protein